MAPNKAFSMTIGTPEPAKQGAPKELTGNYPTVKVLQAMVTRNGMGEWVPIAVALEEDQLHRAAGEWLSKFRDIWGGKFRTRDAPFVIDE